MTEDVERWHEVFQRIRAVRDPDIHLILSLLCSNEGTEAQGGEEVSPPHTRHRYISSWSIWPLSLAFLPPLRSSCGKAVFVGRSGAADWQKEEKWWFQFR